MPEPQSVSYSKISKYLECPELYRRHYILKHRPHQVPLEEALIKGSLTHSLIEEFLKGASKEDAVTLALRPWLTEVCFLDIAGDAGSANQGEGVNLEDLETYAKGCGRLLLRCAETYLDEDKIRNKDGSVPKDPLGYMPGQFKFEYRQAGLDLIKFNIDNQAVRANRSFTRMSLSDIAAVAVGYLYLFELPEYVSGVQSIELDLKQQPVTFRDGRYVWNGILDTEYVTHDEAVILNDHKTEKNKRRPEDVLFDLQLNSYASIRYEQTDKLPDYISITHIASNTVIAAQTDSRIVELSMDYLEEVQKEIDDRLDNNPDGPWLKKWPAKYGSPCLRRHWKNETLERVCPYLSTCWPEYYNCIKEEVDEFFTVNTLDEEPLDVEDFASEF